jgi:hypothetical protein
MTENRKENLLQGRRLAEEYKREDASLENF